MLLMGIHDAGAKILDCVGLRLLDLIVTAILTEPLDGR